MLYKFACALLFVSYISYIHALFLGAIIKSDTFYSVRTFHAQSLCQDVRLKVSHFSISMCQAVFSFWNQNERKIIGCQQMRGVLVVYCGIYGLTLQGTMASWLGPSLHKHFVKRAMNKQVGEWWEASPKSPKFRVALSLLVKMGFQKVSKGKTSGDVHII